jgi:dephospho-CoA kinase
MAVVLVTGMSGTGKSSALAELERRGHHVVDTDHGGWTEEASSTDVRRPFEPLWREDRIYPRFDAIELLSAPADVIMERVAERDTNDYGKTTEQREFILEDLATVEPLLRAGATVEIDTRAPLAEVVDALERIGVTASRQSRAGRLGSAGPRTRGALGRPA